ncbi:MAG: hypothetical protein ACI4JZ_07740 [Oscillospiraceae bacterium]
MLEKQVRGNLLACCRAFNVTTNPLEEQVCDARETSSREFACSLSSVQCCPKSAFRAGSQCSRTKFEEICALVVERFQRCRKIRSGSGFAVLENRVRGNLLARCRAVSMLPQNPLG